MSACSNENCEFFTIGQVLGLGTFSLTHPLELWTINTRINSAILLDDPILTDDHFLDKVPGNVLMSRVSESNRGDEVWGTACGWVTLKLEMNNYMLTDYFLAFISHGKMLTFTLQSRKKR